MKKKYIQLFTLIILIVFSTNIYAQENTQVGLPDGAIARLGKGGINLMRFSPDGARLVVGTDVGVWVYDVQSGNETALFNDKSGQINALAFSPDGKTLASGGFANPIIQLWDLETGTKLTNITYPENNDSTDCLAFTNNGRTLIRLDKSGRITHWDIETTQQLSKRHGVDGRQSVVFSNLFNAFVTGHEDGKIRFWDATTGREQKSLIGHSGFLKRADRDVWTLAFSKDGKTLASGSMDKTVRLWDVEKRKSLGKFLGHESWITAVAFSSDGSMIASGDADKVIKLWDAKTKLERSTLLGHTNGVCALAFSPDGATLASGSYDGTIRFWQQDTGKKSIFTTGHTKWIKSLAFTKNDNTLKTSNFTGTVDLWNLKTRKGLSYLHTSKDQNSDISVLSQDATVYAVNSHVRKVLFYPLDSSRKGGGRVSQESNLQILNISTGEEIHGPWMNEKLYLNSLTFSSDNKMLAVFDARKGVVAWNMASGEEVFQKKIRRSIFIKLVFSSNSRLIAAYDNFSHPRIWDVETQNEVTPAFMNNSVYLAFSVDNTLIATGYGGQMVLWDVVGTEIAERGRIEVSGVRKLIFSPDTKYLLSEIVSGMNYFISVWDIETGNRLLTLPGHTEYITTMQFSHNGKTFASGSQDGTILLWDWEQISKKLRTERIGINLTNNLIPPVVPKQYPSKKEETEAVKSWLNENGYKFQHTPNSYELIHSRGGISVGAGGRINRGPINIITNPNGNIKILVYGVGTGTFIFDENNQLQYNEIPPK